MTMIRDVSFKCDGEASSGERGAKWQWCEMSGKRLTTPNTAPIEIHVNCLNSMGPFRWFEAFQFHLFSTLYTCSSARNLIFLFKNTLNRSDIYLVARQILSYSPYRVYRPWRQNSSKLALKLTLCYRPDTHPFILPTVLLRDYHETVISDILHDGNNVCLLNIHKIITCLYLFLIQQRSE